MTQPFPISRIYISPHRTQFFEYFAANAEPGASALLLEPSIIYTASVLQDAAALREMLSVSTKPGVPPLTEQMLKCALVIMPINDKSDPDAHVGERGCLYHPSRTRQSNHPCIPTAGGGHWSLLVYRRGDGSPARFEHYDSCKGANASHARAVAKCLVALLDPEVGGATTQLVAMQSPQQACTGPRTSTRDDARARVGLACERRSRTHRSTRAQLETFPPTVCLGERVRLRHVRALHCRAALRHRRPGAGCRGAFCVPTTHPSGPLQECTR